LHCTTTLHCNALLHCRYELAIKCYSEAIEKCPADKEMDLATFHQNRSVPSSL
jgi:hypothetical protein